MLAQLNDMMKKRLRQGQTFIGLIRGPGPAEFEFKPTHQSDLNQSKLGFGKSGKSEKIGVNMVTFRLLIALLSLYIGIKAEDSIDRLINAVSSKTVNGKKFIELMDSLEANLANGQPDSRISKLLGNTYFFGRRNVLKPNYKKAFEYFSALNDAESLYMISLCYTLGLGVSRSTERVRSTILCRTASF